MVQKAGPLQNKISRVTAAEMKFLKRAIDKTRMDT